MDGSGELFATFTGGRSGYYGSYCIESNPVLSNFASPLVQVLFQASVTETKSMIELSITVPLILRNINSWITYEKKKEDDEGMRGS